MLAQDAIVVDELLRNGKGGERPQCRWRPTGPARSTRGQVVGPGPPRQPTPARPRCSTRRRRPRRFELGRTCRPRGERVRRPCGPPPLIGGRTPRQTSFRSPTHAHANTMRTQRWRIPTRARSNSANFLTHDTPPPTPARWTGATGQTTTQRSCGDRMGPADPEGNEFCAFTD